MDVALKIVERPTEPTVNVNVAGVPVVTDSVVPLLPAATLKSETESVTVAVTVV